MRMTSRIHLMWHAKSAARGPSAAHLSVQSESGSRESRTMISDLESSAADVGWEGGQPRVHSRIDLRARWLLRFIKADVIAFHGARCSGARSV